MRSVLVFSGLFLSLGGAPVDDLPAPTAQGPKRLSIRNGAPDIPVRLMEGSTEVTVKGRGPLRLLGPKSQEWKSSSGTNWVIRRVSGKPPETLAAIQLGEFAYDDKAGLAQAQADWSQRGLKSKPRILGGVYGIAGKVIDNRRSVLLVDQPSAPPASLEPQQADLLKTHQVRTTLLEEVKAPGAIEFELLDSTGQSVARLEGPLKIESPEGAPIEVMRVEYGVGYDFHNFEDRAYRGSLELTVDRTGKIAVINQVSLEDLLKGLVPAEIFAKAHPEALKAQAVTARGEVLAKIGLKHLADPYFLCTEQHCAVYRGVIGEMPRTNAAVEATRGQALFDAEDRLVDSVYSAICGGHTEDNESVWGGVPNPSLRGKPDVLPGQLEPATPEQLSRFLAVPAAHACRLSTFTSLPKYRWEKRLSASEVNEKLASHHLGPVMAMRVTERGVSGRARVLQVSGEEGATTLRGELNIRRTFGMLNSSMFELKAERDAKDRPTTWVFTGGGWGHGVGLCQVGAIGRAEAGQTYRQILAHYFSNAQVFEIY